MNRDLKMMIWKERKSLFSQSGGEKQVILTMLVTPGIFSILMPWEQGSRYFESPLPVIASILIPMLIVGLTIPESFAGERERHTLATLLASRLSDRDILFGKLIVSIVLGWSITIITLFIGFIVANVTDWTGQLLFFVPVNALAIVVLSFLMAVISASTGVLISLRVATVREAQQTLMATTMFPILLLGVGGGIVLTLDNISNHVTAFLENIEPIMLFLIVTAIFTTTCILLLRVARKRFQRAWLILS